MFIDGRVDLDHIKTPEPDALRRVAIGLIACGVAPDSPITETERAWGRDVAEALGLAQPKGGRYRDPITRSWKMRPDMTEPIGTWTCEGQTSIDELLPETTEENAEDGEKLPCPDC